MWEAYFVLRVCPGSGNILHVCIQNIIFAEIVSLKKARQVVQTYFQQQQLKSNYLSAMLVRV